jgi:hypothetical protein
MKCTDEVRRQSGIRHRLRQPDRPARIPTLSDLKRSRMAPLSSGGPGNGEPRMVNGWRSTITARPTFTAPRRIHRNPDGPTPQAFPQPGLQRSGGPGRGATPTTPLRIYNRQPGQRPNRSHHRNGTTGPLALDDGFCRNADPGPSLRSSPGYGNGWPFGPQYRKEE